MMVWNGFRYYGISLNQAEDPLTPRDDVMEFDVQTNTNGLENNLKLHVFPSESQDKVKEMVTE